VSTAPAVIERPRLEALIERERALFRERTPRSRALAEQGREAQIFGVPMPWMAKWVGGYPLFYAEARGARITDVDGHEYVDFALGDTGSMPGHSPEPTVRAIARRIGELGGVTTMMPTEDSIWVAAELRRRFGLPFWQFALTATDANRFVLRIGVGYPSREHEWEMLERRMERTEEEVEREQAVERPTVLEMQRSLEQVQVEESLGYYIVDLVAATRSAPGVQVGSSPRGSLALLKLARGRAALSGRDYATPDDVKAVAVPALAHRLTLRPELWVERRRSDDIVRELLDQVPTPAVEQRPDPQ